MSGGVVSGPIAVLPSRLKVVMVEGLSLSLLLGLVLRVVRPPSLLLVLLLLTLSSSIVGVVVVVLDLAFGSVMKVRLSAVVVVKRVNTPTPSDTRRLFHDGDGGGSSGTMVVAAMIKGK